MKIEVEVKFKIGDKVKILNKKPGDRWDTDSDKAVIKGYVIHYNNGIKVYYTLDALRADGSISKGYNHMATNHKARYTAKDLELISD